MSFTQNTFAPIASRSADVPAMFSYKTADTLSQVSAAGYFLDKRFQFQPGDVIWVTAGAGDAFIKYRGESEDSEAIAPRLAEPSLIAESFANQAPGATDTPIQITFGAAQGTGADPLQISAGGLVTFNEPGAYVATLLLQLGRAGGSGGTAELYVRTLKNGSIEGNTVLVALDNANLAIPVSLTAEVLVSAGDTLAAEIMRDSAGVNQGGLLTASPANPAFNDVPSAKASFVRTF